MSRQSMLLVGGSDKTNRDYSLLKELSLSPSKTKDRWGCMKSAKKGDELWFYIIAPISAIVACGTAMRDAKPGDHWNYDTKVGEITWIEPHITSTDLTEIFPEWKWGKSTRGKMLLNDKDAAKLRKFIKRKGRKSSTDDSEVEHLISKQGAGFGDPKKNREAELAAISYAKQSFQKDGYKVRSVESLNLGYDLVANKGSTELHLEVKGVSGNVPNFIITANETELAKRDKSFRLIIVLNALNKSKSLLKLNNDQFFKKYDLNAIAYRAVSH
jgi:hypothetical protein